MDGLNPSIIDIVLIFMGLDMKVAQLIGRGRHFPLPLSAFFEPAFVKGLAEVIFHPAVLYIVIPALVQLFNVFSRGQCVLIFNFLEQFFVLLIDAEDEALEGSLYLFPLPPRLQINLGNALAVDLLFALFLDHHLREGVYLVCQVLAQQLA